LKEHNPAYIRYGINLHNGGLDRMIKESQRDFWWMKDYSGWDRLLSFLNDVQGIRNRALKKHYSNYPEIWNQIKDLAMRVSNMIVQHPLLLPDGVVVKGPRVLGPEPLDESPDRSQTQMSGDGETTQNNSIAHDIIVNFELIEACPEATDEEICEQATNKYGDDILASATEQFAKMKELEFHKELARKEGMTVKEGSFMCKKYPIGLSFLGGTIRAFESHGSVYYVPSFNRDRILSGLQISTDDLASDDEIMKAFSLLELGWYDCYDEISSYIRYLFQKLPCSPVLRHFKMAGIPTRNEIKLRWAGLLNESKTQGFSFLYPGSGMPYWQSE
jgi:hypothetical protein